MHEPTHWCALSQVLEQEEEKEEEEEEEFIEGDDEEDSEAEVRQHLVSGGMQQPRDSPAPSRCMQFQFSSTLY